MGKENINKIDVTFLMRKSCEMCLDIKRNISDYMYKNIHINYRIIDLDDVNCSFTKRKSSITPALWVNDKMWYAGVFDLKKFEKKVTEIIK